MMETPQPSPRPGWLSRAALTLQMLCMTLLVAAPLGAATPKPPAGANDAAPMEILRLDKDLDAVIAPGTQIERVATGFKFVEGPMWRQGRLWFSDLVANKMYAVAPDGKAELLIDHSGGLENPPPGSFTGSNAMVTEKSGSVLMLQHGMRRIVRLDDHFGMHPFLERFEGKRFNSPNDLVFAERRCVVVHRPSVWPFGAGSRSFEGVGFQRRVPIQQREADCAHSRSAFAKWNCVLSGW